MPRIEYKLSFENYLEMTTSRRRKPNYGWALTFALSGFLLLLAGYVLLRFLPDILASVGGVFLATGLVAVSAALLLALLAGKQATSSDLASLRKEYVQHHSDSRALEFDERGWEVHWYQGEDFRPWASLRSLHNWKTLLVLSTDTTSYWLPKEALEREGQLGTVRKLAVAALRSGETLFTVPACPSALVYTAASLFHNLRRAVLTRFFCYLFVVLMVSWLGFANPDHPLLGLLWLLLLVPVILIACEGLQVLGKYYRTFRSAVSREAEIMSDRIAYETDKVIWTGLYERITQVREIPGALLLYGSPRSFQLIPTKGFSGEQLRRFRELLSKNLERLHARIGETR